MIFDILKRSAKINGEIIMVNEKKIRLMTQMAMYEKHDGDQDQRISSYYRNDYRSFNIVITFLWVTLGFIALAVLILIGMLEYLMEHFELPMIIMVGSAFVVGYLVLVILFLIASYVFYEGKYQKARKNMKRFNRDLIRLLKM